MSGHSKGPWAVEALRYEGARIVAGKAFDKSSKPIGWVAADDTIVEPSTGRIREVMSDEAYANANLISASPDLYEALRPFAEAWGDLTDSACHNGITTPEKCGRCSKVLAARAAIAKAEGGGR